MADDLIDREHADDLQEILEEGRDKWPLPQEAPIVEQIVEFAAFGNSDAVRLAELCGWQTGAHQNLPYICDPLGERIKEAFADLIVGTEPSFESAKPDDEEEGGPPPKDQDLLDELVEENDLPSELHEAVGQLVAEGETWWRLYVDRDAYEHPVIEWHSRANVVPLYRGRKLLAAAFVTDLDDLAPDAPVIRTGDASNPLIGESPVTGTPGPRNWRENEGKRDDSSDTVYRYIEIQAGGFTRNLLYRGTPRALGVEVSLGEHDTTADLPEEWEHGLEIETPAGRSVPVMLAGRITNGRAGRLGRSQLHRAKGLLYELNKLQSIGSRNADLTMQKRAVLMQEMVDGLVKAGHGSPISLPDAFVAPRDTMGDQQAMGVLEFSDTWAEALKLWDDHIVDKALTRCRVAPQLVGRHTEDAATGPALKARLIDSVLAADGKALKVDDEVPRMLRAAQLLSALPEEQGGCGHDWVSPEEEPVFARTSILPEDEDLEATRYSTLSTAGLISRQTAIEQMHPDWDADRVREELERIAAEQPEDPEAMGDQALDAAQDPFAVTPESMREEPEEPSSAASPTRNGQGPANEATLRLKAV